MPSKRWNKNWKEAQAKRDAGRFITLPAAVINSVAYIGLSMHAKALLIDIVEQYRGNNNGDLSVTWKQMKARNWRSQETLLKAKRELLERGLIDETRMGARPNKASLYAVTWHALDHCGGKLEISPRTFRRGAYTMLNPLPPIRPKINGLTTPFEVTAPAIASHGEGMGSSTTPPNDAIRG